VKFVKKLYIINFIDLQAKDIFVSYIKFIRKFLGLAYMKRNMHVVLKVVTLFYHIAKTWVILVCRCKLFINFYLYKLTKVYNHRPCNNLCWKELFKIKLKNYLYVAHAGAIVTGCFFLFILRFEPMWLSVCLAKTQTPRPAQVYVCILEVYYYYYIF